MVRVTLAGATGWAGSALARGIAETTDIKLVAAVSRSAAGGILGDLLEAISKIPWAAARCATRSRRLREKTCSLYRSGYTCARFLPAFSRSRSSQSLACMVFLKWLLDEKSLDCRVYGSIEEALKEPSDIFFEYTKPDRAKEHILSALYAGRHVVVGTSGLTSAEYAEIDQVARKQQRGVLAVGNFALTVVLLQKFAEIAARFIDHWEIIDYAHEHKRDAPSGTTRELAHRLSMVNKARISVPLDEVMGEASARGATVNGSQIHSLRLPGYVIGAEIIFGMADQKLSIRHEAGPSAEPYVAGALLAIRKVATFVGLRRGLDSVMDFETQV